MEAKRWENKVVIIDIDDCVLEWRKAFDACYNHVDLHSYTEGRNATINEFNKSDQFGELEAVPCSVSAINHMIEQGAVVIYVSSCLPNTSNAQIELDCYNKRANNLRTIGLLTHEGNVELLECLPLGSSKREILEHICKCAKIMGWQPFAFIDDITSHCEAAVGLVDNVIYLKRTFHIEGLDFNSNLNKDITAITGWHEVYQTLNERFYK